MTSHVARIVLAALLATAVARAEPPPDPPRPPGDTIENRALVHLDRGVAAYRAGDFHRAHAELALANQLAPDRPNPYRWLALTEAALGDCDSALVNVEGFLSRVAADDPRVGELRALRERCLRTPRRDAPRSGSSGTLGSSRSSDSSRSSGPSGSSGSSGLSGSSGSFGPSGSGSSGPSGSFGSSGSSGSFGPSGSSGSAWPVAPAVAAQPPADPPVYRRWWFWTAIGAVAITAAGTTYALTRDAPSRLPPVTCGPAGCHP